MRSKRFGAKMARMYKFAPALALTLAACAHKPPAVEVRTVEVPVIRVTHCLDAKDIPAKPKGLPSPRPSTITAALDVAVATALDYANYADKADAILRGCATRSTTP